jgi:hypothetical protein
MHPREREIIALKPHCKAASQDYGKQIPTILIQEMMPSTNIGPNVSIDVRNRVVKK